MNDCMWTVVSVSEEGEKSRESAGFAKWQYETLAECKCQLRPLRQIAKRFIGEDTCSHFQDREMQKAVVGACRNQRLWKIFIEAVGREVLSPLEQVRRWCLVCQCCIERRR